MKNERTKKINQDRILELHYNKIHIAMVCDGHGMNGHRVS